MSSQWPHSLRVYAPINTGFSGEGPAGAELVAMYDLFDRADAAALGQADSGQQWLTPSGTWKLLGKVAKAATFAGGIAQAIIEMYTPDVITRAVIDTASISQALISRVANDLTAVKLQAIGGNLILKAAAGAIVGSVAYVPHAGDAWELRAEGTTFSASVNGVLLLTITNAAFNAGNTQHGVELYTLNDGWREFSILPIADTVPGATTGTSTDDGIFRDDITTTETEDLYDGKADVQDGGKMFDQDTGGRFSNASDAVAFLKHVGAVSNMVDRTNLMAEITWADGSTTLATVVRVRRLDGSVWLKRV